MIAKAKITSKGQITLPKKLRDALGIKSGDVVEFKQNDSGNYELVKPQPDGRGIEALFGMIKTDINLSDEELKNAIGEAAAASGMSGLGEHD